MDQRTPILSFKCVMVGLILASVVTWAIFFLVGAEFFIIRSVCLKREQHNRWLKRVPA